MVFDESRRYPRTAGDFGFVVAHRALGREGPVLQLIAKIFEVLFRQEERSGEIKFVTARKPLGQKFSDEIPDLLLVPAVSNHLKRSAAHLGHKINVHFIAGANARTCNAKATQTTWVKNGSLGR